MNRCCCISRHCTNRLCKHLAPRRLPVRPAQPVDGEGCRHASNDSPNQTTAWSLMTRPGCSCLIFLYIWALGGDGALACHQGYEAHTQNMTSHTPGRGQKYGLQIHSCTKRRGRGKRVAFLDEMTEKVQGFCRRCCPRPLNDFFIFSWPLWTDGLYDSPPATDSLSCHRERPKWTDERASILIHVDVNAWLADRGHRPYAGLL